MGSKATATALCSSINEVRRIPTAGHLGLMALAAPTEKGGVTSRRGDPSVPRSVRG